MQNKKIKYFSNNFFIQFGIIFPLNNQKIIVMNELTYLLITARIIEIL